MAAPKMDSEEQRRLPIPNLVYHRDLYRYAGPLIDMERELPVEPVWKGRMGHAIHMLNSFSACFVFVTLHSGPVTASRQNFRRKIEEKVFL
jgi:hypothetical protein